MKKFFKALGIALLYYGVFLGTQFLVSLIAGIVIAFSTFSGQFFGGDIDSVMADYSAKVLESTNLISLISNIVAVLIVLIIFFARKKNPLREVNIKKFSFPTAALSWLFGIGCLLTMSVVIEFIPFSDDMINSFSNFYSVINGGSYVIRLIAVGIAAPIAEEFFFRGLVYSRLKEGMRPVAAGAVASLLFGISHGHPIWILSAFLMGVIFTLVFEFTGSLVPCIILHMINNFIALFTQNIPTPDYVNIIILVAASLAAAVTSVILVRNRKKELIR